MTETNAEQAVSSKQPEHPDEDKCPDPFGPYTRYRVAAEMAKKRDELFTADATAMETRYGRLAGAQQKYADALAAQKNAWADLSCQLECVRKKLHGALDKATRTKLENCWTSLRTETTKAAQPADCTEIVNLDCKKVLEGVTELEPDKLAEALARWRSQADRASICTGQDDQAFDDLANFPEQLPGQIAGLQSRADQIDQDLGKSGNDPQRSYVEYLALHHDFCELWRKLITAAAYTCQLKYTFVHLLKTHQASICLQVAIDGAGKRASIEDEANQAKAKNVVDLVLECAMPAQPDNTTRLPADCAPTPEQTTTPTSTETTGE